MSRIAALDPAITEGATRQTLDAVNKSLGVTPNLFRVAAQAPAALGGLVGLSGALARGGFDVKTREAIALAVAEANGCDYCLSAHSALGAGAGLSAAAMACARRAEADDPKGAGLLRLARAIVEARGRLSDDELAAARRAGLSDGDVVETVAHVALNVFTNYLNLVAGTDIDFPVVRTGVIPRAA